MGACSFTSGCTVLHRLDAGQSVLFLCTRVAVIIYCQRTNRGSFSERSSRARICIFASNLTPECLLLSFFLPFGTHVLAIVLFLLSDTTNTTITTINDTQHDNGNNEDDESQQQVLSRAFTKDPWVARRDAVTAALLALAPRAGRDLAHQFESLFRASLTHYSDDATTTTNSSNAMDQDNHPPELESLLSKSETLKLQQNLRTMAWLMPNNNKNNHKTWGHNSLLYTPLLDALQSVLHAKVVELIAGDFETE